jgi:hypothetical protein
MDIIIIVIYIFYELEWNVRIFFKKKSPTRKATKRMLDKDLITQIDPTNTKQWVVHK